MTKTHEELPNMGIWVIQCTLEFRVCKAVHLKTMSAMASIWKTGVEKCVLSPENVWYGQWGLLFKTIVLIAGQNETE